MTSPALYGRLASWWPLLAPREHAAGEAAVLLATLDEAAGAEVASLLELGSGAGHLASHLPEDLEVVLVDASEAMLEQSRKTNPRREHHLGDMRTLALGRTFDAVLVHDAVMYLTSVDDLRAAVHTAWRHLRPGGVALFVPDLVREDFAEGIVAGGNHRGARAAKLLEWRWDPDPDDHTFQVDFALLLRDEGGRVECVHDQHTMGMFTRMEWFEALRSAGFELVAVAPPGGEEIGESFVGRRSPAT